MTETITIPLSEMLEKFEIYFWLLAGMAVLIFGGMYVYAQWVMHTFMRRGIPKPPPIPEPPPIFDTLLSQYGGKDA